jgi:hypothetical protein
MDATPRLAWDHTLDGLSAGVGLARLAAALVPRARAVLLLRDPVERFRSEFAYFARTASTGQRAWAPLVPGVGSVAAGGGDDEAKPRSPAEAAAAPWAAANGSLATLPADLVAVCADVEKARAVLQGRSSACAGGAVTEALQARAYASRRVQPQDLHCAAVRALSLMCDCVAHAGVAACATRLQRWVHDGRAGGARHEGLPQPTVARVAAGLYVHHLLEWERRFSRGAMLVMVHEELSLAASDSALRAVGAAAVAACGPAPSADTDRARTARSPRRQVQSRTWRFLGLDDSDAAVWPDGSEGPSPPAPAPPRETLALLPETRDLLARFYQPSLRGLAAWLGGWEGCVVSRVWGRHA